LCGLRVGFANAEIPSEAHGVYHVGPPRIGSAVEKLGPEIGHFPFIIEKDSFELGDSGRRYGTGRTRPARRLAPSKGLPQRSSV
jgi:hypothetical protein